MPPALTKNTAAWTLVSLFIGWFVCGMLFTRALGNYFQNDATFLYLFLFIFSLYGVSSIVYARRLLRSIPGT